ncbi:MAG: hypothetical protein ACYTFW_20800 [Planctomycetota bacterium]|jgi:hypothetical protein
MIEYFSRQPLKSKDLNVAELIEWGYETSGDFDEAVRVYSDKAFLDGFELQYTETELVRAREDFDLEFGD